MQVKGGAQGETYLTGVKQVSVGGSANCAVTTSGALYCWGTNSYGQLGDNSTTASLVPVQVVGVGGTGTLSNVSQISVRCAVTTDGAVYCWGGGEVAPVQVLGINGIGTLSNISQVSSGVSICALTDAETDREVVCWGGNVYGGFGNGESWYVLPMKIYDGSGETNPCTTECCSHWNYEDINSSCMNGIYQCFSAIGDYSVVCAELPATPTQTVTNTETFTKTYTPSNTFTETYTPSETFTKTYTPSETFTKTYTPSNTFTKTYTPSETFTKTYTPSETFTKTYTPSNTFTKTDTLEMTMTHTPSITFTPVDGVRVVAPMTILKVPSIDNQTKNSVRVILEKFIGASQESETKLDPEAKYKYLIHIRKLKRLGYKDKRYKLGVKNLTLKKTNKHTFKNLDKGIYSIRYRIIITKGKIVKKTKWSERNLVIS